LARLDVIFLVFATALILLRKPRRNFWIVGIQGLILGIYLSINLFITGHLIPTSGIAKSLSVPGQLYNTKFFHQMLSVQNPANGNLWVVFALAFLLSLGLVCIVLFNMLWTRSHEKLEQNRVQFVVASFFVLYTLYYLLRSSWVLWRWYSYPLVLFSIFVLPPLIEQVLRRFKKYPLHSRILKVLLGGTYPTSLAAQTLNERLSFPAIAAMGDRAGSFAYFFNGDVLQLEGLLGEYKLLHAIDSNRLMEYVNEFSVDYIVSYKEPPSDYVIWELLSPLPEHTIGPSGAIILCKESELFNDLAINGLYVWKWPSCAE